MRSVKRCIKWGQTLGYIDTNPIQHISIPASTPNDVYLTSEQFTQLLSETRDANFRDLLEVTYESGCRPQESLRIEIRHIDLPNQRWVLPRSEAKGKQAPRVVYLSDKAIEITRRLIGDRTAGRLFLNSKGKPWTTNAVNCAFQRIQHRMGMAEMKREGISVAEEKIAEFIPTLSKTHRVGKKVVAKNDAELRH